MTSTFIEENCTIEHEGRTFESGGAFVSETHLVAYAGEDGRVTDWHGNPLGTYRITSSWVQPGAWGCPKMHAMRVTIDGRTYAARGMGTGMILKGKRIAAELKS